MYSLNQQGIEIYECEHNTTDIGKQYTLCIDRNRRDFTPINSIWSYRCLPKLTYPSLSQSTPQYQP